MYSNTHRVIADDRERTASQALMTAELTKRELESKTWMLEENVRQNETQLEQLRGMPVLPDLVC